jgi:hypothetical protein
MDRRALIAPLERRAGVHAPICRRAGSAVVVERVAHELADGGFVVLRAVVLGGERSTRSEHRRRGQSEDLKERAIESDEVFVDECSADE